MVEALIRGEVNVVPSKSAEEVKRMGEASIDRRTQEILGKVKPVKKAKVPVGDLEVEKSKSWEEQEAQREKWNSEE